MSLSNVAASVHPPLGTNLSPGSLVVYEQHGVPLLATLLQEEGGKWLLFNAEGATCRIPSGRLEALPGTFPGDCSSEQMKVAFLLTTTKAARTCSTTFDLAALWELTHKAPRIYTPAELTSLLHAQHALETISTESALAVRFLLYPAQPYFKRHKDGFEPRTDSDIGERKKVAEENALEQERQIVLRNTILARLKNPNVELPPGLNFHDLEQIAAHGSRTPNAKATLALLQQIEEAANIYLGDNPEARAFQLLVKLGRFHEKENLTFYRLGRPKTFSPAEEHAALVAGDALNQALLESREDMTHLVAITIDAPETLDMDDALSLEHREDKIILGVHISDVSSLIPRNSELERLALERGSSIYCPEETVPMLPRHLSENVLSLRENEPRPAISFFLTFDSSYNLIHRDIRRTTIKVRHRLNYDFVDNELFNESARCSALSPLLLSLWSLSSHLETLRISQGALAFSRRSVIPVVQDDNSVELLSVNEETPARKLVSELMIAANETAARFAWANKVPFLFRSQPPPDIDISQLQHSLPEGVSQDNYRMSFMKPSALSFTPGPHFGLALEAYAQVTSPIRRAFDLQNQQQLSSMLLHKTPCWTLQDLRSTFHTIEAANDTAQLIQRERARFWVLEYLVQKNIVSLDGIVVRLDGPKPVAYIELLGMNVSFRSPRHLYKNSSTETSLTLGTKVQLAIKKVDPHTDRLVLDDLN